MQIREAEERDLPAMLALYNDAILNSLAIWQYDPVDLDNRRTWLHDKRARNFPLLIAEDAQGFAGYATYGDFRPFAGYHRTVENSVYIMPERRGAGVGRALMNALLDIARERGVHMMVAAIALPNDGSVALHKAMGFDKVGLMPQVGYKKNQFLDLLLMQRQV
ncbi:GNAT family N-acetyltransferase [Methylovirgula sp. 4M-Z18]|uniref:GNAT family N-acetyltransferase n=1 Tax=Methylovirgula sp. 4M-Z18 TaxID=2293567 RepID=UPI000E2E955A|nr:GNAT family N-acetyltransferase [Methylovirgula sp. 4M-Z18]RFB79204.1 N-acetyltransferase [Methylovirgula sp. 4M-Z18]